MLSLGKLQEASLSPEVHSVENFLPQSSILLHRLLRSIMAAVARLNPHTSTTASGAGDSKLSSSFPSIFSARGTRSSPPDIAALGVRDQNSTSPTNSLNSTTISQVSSTSTISPSPSVTTSSSSSHAPSKETSTSTHQDPYATSSTHTPLPTPSHRLSNGAVAGIAVGAALGLALITFLATFLIMRRKRHAKGKRQYRLSKNHGEFELNTSRQQNSATVAKHPFTTETPVASGTYETYLPQSADDRTVQQKAKATLDHIELHVENFYRNSSSSAVRPDNAELAAFDSPFLPATLASLLPRSKNRVNIIKHALAQCIVPSISPTANPARSLLPTEYTLLPHTATSARSSIYNKAGKQRAISCRFSRAMAN